MLWLAATVRGMDNPAFCRQGSDHPSAKVFPLEKSARQVAMLDSQDDEVQLYRHLLCHSSPTVYDANDTLWLSGTGPVADWVNTKMLDETGRCGEVARLVAIRARHQLQRQARRLCRAQRPARPEQGQAIVPGSGPYAVMPSPVDGSIWYTVGVFGGPPAFLRFDPATGLSEVFNVPAPAFGIRGGDIDKNGVVWASLSSGHLGSFDRRKCQGPLNGPNATGNRSASS
jgi:streptogramin lyase